MNCVLETSGLTKTYKSCTALDHLTLQLQPGHIYGLIGSNGAGKSTLIHILAGLLSPTEGSYSILGAKSARENRLKLRETGFLFTDAGTASEMTALQNLIALQKLKGYTDKAEARALLDRVGLDPSKASHEPLNFYSTGQRQRVALAAALLGKPRLLVLDEPLIGLDPEAIRLTGDILRQEQSERGAAILLSSHNLPELYRLATDYIFLHHGRLMECIDHETLQSRRTYSITLTAEPLALARDVLTEQYPDQHIRTDRETLILEDCTIPMAALQTALTQNGVSVTSLTASGSSLEDYFMSVIGGEAP